MFRAVAFFAWILLAVTIAGLAYNQVKITQNFTKQQTELSTAPTEQDTPSLTNDLAIASVNASSLATLQASVSALQSQVNQLQKNSGKTTTVVTNPNSSAFQTQIVYLGAASTTSNSWTNTGVQITLNSNDYPAGTPVNFQAGLSIIGGQAWARLINTTTGAIMSVTEVQNGSSTITWVNSPNFQLFSGSNTYTVQMKSTSGEVAQMAGARLVIGNQ